MPASHVFGSAVTRAVASSRLDTERCQRQQRSSANGPSKSFT
jgi:hypothetical protein